MAANDSDPAGRLWPGCAAGPRSGPEPQAESLLLVAWAAAAQRLLLSSSSCTRPAVGRPSGSAASEPRCYGGGVHRPSQWPGSGRVWSHFQYSSPIDLVRDHTWVGTAAPRRLRAGARTAAGSGRRYHHESSPPGSAPSHRDCSDTPT